ncbi:MAG: hypothetical protein QG646_4302 [Euryarchaeota archaeon]|nr:hypothetical protein [Euryarchaeota archaeon]
MSLPIPNLDNRTFEQLLQEARKSISNYAAQWTNHNPADPGITLIELFAWLAEITSYRINLVTEEHRLKYLKLLGIRPQGILPATVDLNFETEQMIHLKKGRVFLAEKAGEWIDFELSKSITVIPLNLEKIIVNEMSAVLSPSSSLSFSQAPNLSKGIFDRSVANTKEDLFFAPFGLDTRKNSQLYLGFNFKARENIRKDCENPYKSLSFMCYLYEKDFIKPGKHGDETEYKLQNAKLKWEILFPDGKQPKEVFPEDGTQNFTKSGSLFFNNLEGWVCSYNDDWLEGKYLWLRCTLLESEYEYPPRIEKISLNTATVVQKKRVKDSLLTESNGFPDQVFKLPETPVLRGSLKLVVTWEECIEIAKSNGLPDQVFKLPETPVLRGSLKLVVSGEEWIEVEDFDGSGPESPHFTLDSLIGEIRLGDGLRGKVPREGTEIRALEWEEWIEVEDFDGSGPESPHFTLDSLKGEIKFGDGLRGKIPGDGKNKVIRALEYETGKGEQGNLQAFSKWEVKVGKIEGLRINNFKPATGGKREESITEAFERFNRDMSIPYRAVTSEDFEYIARETPGLRVAQAKAIKNLDPYSQADMDGSVTVVIIPFSPLDIFNTPPRPSRCFRDAVARHLEKHRLLGTRVHVVSPEYVKVKVQAILGISEGFSEKETRKEEIRKKVLCKLNLFLHPVKGGISGKGWPVGEPVYRSDIYRVIMGTEGVEWVEKINIYAQKGAITDKNGDLMLNSKIATIYSGEHSIEISGKGR